MLKGRTRSTAAKCFFEILVLKSKDIIETKQTQPYGDIIISKSV